MSGKFVIRGDQCGNGALLSPSLFRFPC